MNWSSIGTTLLGTVVGGLVLIVIALVIHKQAPQWTGFKTLIMGGGAVMFAPIGALLMELIYWLAQWPFRWIGDALGAIHNTGGQDAQAVITWLGGPALPWIVFIVLAVLLLLAMYPRVSAFRAAQGMSGKLGAVHKAGHNTLWIAAALPAAGLIVLAPSLIADPSMLTHLAGK